MLGGGSWAEGVLWSYLCLSVRSREANPQFGPHPKHFRFLTRPGSSAYDTRSVEAGGRGEVAEWLKAPLSKSGILAKTGIVGSNPTLSASTAPG